MGRRLGLVIACLALLAPAAPATAAIELHAHRGGTLDTGVPVTPENSMVAFMRAHELGIEKIEIDVKLTSDRVPVIMHDATLDRTTNCAGLVRDRTAEELASDCRIDIIGTTGNLRELGPGEEPQPIPTLAEFLTWADSVSAGVNLELKNVPTDPDFDATPAYVQTVLPLVESFGLDKDLVQIQSFWPPDVDPFEALGYKTALLTLQPMNEGAIAFSALRGYDALGPQWPPLSPTYVAAAQAAGFQVIPYTLNTEAAMAAAEAAGVDGVITDDPDLALEVLRNTP